MLKIKALAFGLLLLLFIGCDPDAGIPSLYKHYEGIFEIGAAIEPEQFERGGKEKSLLVDHFSSVTPENVMKWISIHPEEDKWNFGPADWLVEFALKEGKKIRGHCLIWHHPDQVADWMFTDESGNPASRELMLKRMEKHIKTVVGRYKGKVYAWDVVNEPIDTKTDDQLRHTKWYELIGPDYIEYAFRFAHEADPDALLFINEDNTQETKQMNALIKLISNLKAKGVPIHGLGMEMHITIARPTIEAIEKSIQKYRELGIVLHVTELDMSLYAQEFETLTEPPAAYLIHQAHRYKELFNVFVKNKDLIKNVTFWGYHDGHTWLRHFPKERLDWPLLFDDKFKVKYAYWALVKPESLPADDAWTQKKKPAQVYSASKGTPKIDGEVDAIWSKAPEVSTEVFALGSSGAKAKVRLLWDPNSIYVLAEITDPVLSDKASQAHEKDSFEVFIDENNGKTSSFEEDDYQLRVNYKNAKSWLGSIKENDFTSAVKITDTGYRVEIAIKLKTIKATGGSQLGLELQVNDDNGAGKRTAITKWNDPTNESWRDPSGWGILELVE